MKSILLSFLALGIGVSAVGDFFKDHSQLHDMKCRPGDHYPLADNLNHTWYDEVSNGGGWYYVMGSKWHFITLTRALTGHWPRSQEALAKACFTNKRHDVDGKKGFIITGYAENGEVKKAAYTCDHDMDMEEKVQHCKPTHDSTSETHAAIRGTTEATIVWTDNKKYVLGYRCAAHTKVWSLRSSENKAADKHTKEIVLKKITDDHFNRHNVVEIPRERCHHDN